jgi:hypothetical protein
MKSLIIGFITLVSLQSYAVTVELGKYIAKDVKTQRDKVATFNLKAGGLADMTIQTSLGLVRCTGKYSVAGDDFKAHVNCNSILLPETDVTINIGAVTPENLRSAPGARVTVMLDIFDAPEDFYLQKLN